jgi:hypothetical protein
MVEGGAIEVISMYIRGALYRILAILLSFTVTE